MHAAELNTKGKVWTQTVPQKEYYTVKNVSVILDVGPVQIRGWIKRGTLKAYRVNGVISVKHEDLVAYIARRGSAGRITGELMIEEIIPERKKSKASRAAALVDDEDLDEDDLSFLDADDEDEDE